MFILASPAVEESLSCPYRVTLTFLPWLASSPTFRSSDPEPQVGSYTVVLLEVAARRMPRIWAMIRLTSAGV